MRERPKRFHYVACIVHGACHWVPTDLSRFNDPSAHRVLEPVSANAVEVRLQLFRTALNERHLAFEQVQDFVRYYIRLLRGASGQEHVGRGLRCTRHHGCLRNDSLVIQHCAIADLIQHGVKVQGWISIARELQADWASERTADGLLKIYAEHNPPCAFLQTIQAAYTK